MAEKNIAALLDSKAYTIHVQYQHGTESENTYTYVCNLPELSTGDFVVVPTKVKTANYKPGDYMKGNGEMLPEMRKYAASLLSGKRLSIAKVISIDPNVDIEPNDDIDYAWVVSRVDLTSYAALMERNKQVTDAVQEAYKQSLRKSFAERILGDMPSSDRDNLLRLLNK